MLRQPTNYERIIFEVIREYEHRFFYEDICCVVEGETFKAEIKKLKEEMVGKACVSFSAGDTINYEIRYNRVVNINENYALLIPGVKTG